MNQASYGTISVYAALPTISTISTTTAWKEHSYRPETNLRSSQMYGITSAHSTLSSETPLWHSKPTNSQLPIGLTTVKPSTIWLSSSSNKAKSTQPSTTPTKAIARPQPLKPPIIYPYGTIKPTNSKNPTNSIKLPFNCTQLTQSRRNWQLVF